MPVAGTRVFFYGSMQNVDGRDNRGYARLDRLGPAMTRRDNIEVYRLNSFFNPCQPSK
jgi:hypothetical protein